MNALGALAWSTLLAASTPQVGQVDPRESAAIGPGAQGRLEAAQKLYDSLDYDRVLPLVAELLAQPGLPASIRIQAYQLQGSCLAIVGPIEDADTPFRLLIRLKPDFDLPASTPPKILSVFRRVRDEEHLLADQERDLRRRELVESLALEGSLPTAQPGGYPVHFSLRVRDPNGIVADVHVPFRREGQLEFSSVALERSSGNRWVGRIPGELTLDPKGFNLQFYVEARDASGPLLSLGSPSAPRVIAISRGTTVRESPPPLPRWAFLTGAGATAVAGITSGALGVALAHQRQQVASLIANARTAPLAGTSLDAEVRRGQSLATATTVSLVVLAVVAAGTGALVPFINWDGLTLEAP